MIVIFDYIFINPQLLKEALTHPSKNLKSKVNNQRFEFLGDAILNFVICNLLFTLFPNDSEGYLAKKRSYLVGNEVLAKIAHEHELNKYLIISSSEEKSGGRNNNNILEDALEAVIAAIYLDSDINVISKVIKKLWQPYLDSMLEVPTDSKSKVQEFIQKQGIGLPQYKLLEVKGSDHQPEFTIELICNNYQSVFGIGSSKQKAEKEAAKKFLELYVSN